VGAHESVRLPPDQVADLQYFLMDAAKRYVLASGGRLEDADELLACAAALDYALLVASERAYELEDDAGPVAATLRETMTRAANAALDFVERMVRAPESAFDDFVERHIRAGGVFDVVRALREGGVVTAHDVAFRALTLANDILERRRAG
jgi:hypothetical protein